MHDYWTFELEYWAKKVGQKMFESQYNDEMEAEVLRLEALKRATDAGHPEWTNACASCGCELKNLDSARCPECK